MHSPEQVGASVATTAEPTPPQIELRIAMSEDERAPKAVCVVEFDTIHERDQVAFEMQARWTAAKEASPAHTRQGLSGLHTLSNFGLSVVGSVADIVPEKVEIVAMYKTEAGATGRFVMECVAGGSSWHVIKRYHEFHQLREELRQQRPAIEDVP